MEAAARRVVDEAIQRRIFPAATIEVGDNAGVLWHDALGTLTFDPDSAPARHDTPFDLASLTKVIATTTVIMQLVDQGKLRLDANISQFLAEWRGAVGVIRLFGRRPEPPLGGSEFARQCPLG